METLGVVVRFFHDGGIFMYPILIVLAFGTAIAIERYVVLTTSTRTNQRVWDRVLPALQGGHYDRAQTEVSHSDAAIATVLSYGLARTGSTPRREDIETAMEEGLMEIIPRLEKRTHYLASFANIATLLGLLGTIIGLIQAFAAVASADPAEKAALLSSSIAIAMNTTAFGLVAAIPLLMIHSVLQTKTTEIVDSLEMAAVKFLNMVASRPSASHA